MFQVKARTSTVVIGEHVLHVDRPVHYPDSVPPEVAARTDLVEITELLETDGVDHAGDRAGTDATDDAGTAGADTAGGEPTTDLSSPVDTSVSGALDDAALAGVTLLHVEGGEEDEDAGADLLQPPDPFADDSAGAPAEPAAGARKTTRIASGGRR